MTSTQQNRYDLILIGSGIGALTVASLMALLRGKKVLVLERHFRVGGFTHSFKRQKFHWDVGLHYVGDMSKGSPTRSLFDLVTGSQVDWQPMPDVFDKFVYPGFTFSVRSSKENYIADLIERFPQEAKAIRQYFSDVEKATTAFQMQLMRRSGSLMLKLLGNFWGLFDPQAFKETTKEYLDRHFQNQELKALLVSQWGTYGLPPEKSPFPLHALIVRHYLNGGYYPVGGAGVIASSVQKIVEEKGGKFLLNREATQILIENGRVVGVRVRKVNAKNNGKDNMASADSSLTGSQEEYSQEKYAYEEYYAPVVVSNVGAANTYLKLIPSDYPITFRESLRSFVEKSSPTTNITLYLGLSKDPRCLGINGENYWIYDTLDHDKTFQQKGEWVAGNKPLGQVYLSFPSQKDPKAEAHTAEVMAFTDYDQFAQWRNQDWLKRDEEYQLLKQRLSRDIIAFVEKHLPGFADLIEYHELSTPLTNEHFTSHQKGAIYGLPFVKERLQGKNLSWTDPKTPVTGLYLTGADVSSLGIMGAMMGGVVTLGNLPEGISIPQVFTTAMKRQ
jgi:all-trans-retinol 13,14-reductase